MGMFDTFNFRCTNCGHAMSDQSKAGPCYLNEYTVATVPASVAESISGYKKCTECAHVFQIKAIVSTKILFLECEENEEVGDVSES